MADKTTYTIEVWDPAWSLDGDAWSMNGSRVYNTYAEAQEDVEKVSETYRKVQVVQHTRTVVAEYKDGQVSG